MVKKGPPNSSGGSSFVKITRTVKVLGERYPVGFKILWGSLISGLFGGIVLGIFQGLISLPLGLARAATLYFDTVANRVAMVIRAVFGADGAFRVAWLEANAQVVSSGILAFALGVAIVGSVTVVYSWGVTRLG